MGDTQARAYRCVPSSTRGTLQAETGEAEGPGVGAENLPEMTLAQSRHWVHFLSGAKQAETVGGRIRTLETGKASGESQEVIRATEGSGVLAGGGNCFPTVLPQLKWAESNRISPAQVQGRPSDGRTVQIGHCVHYPTSWLRNTSI